MNKQRRKQLADLEEALRDLHHKLDDVMSEEAEALDAMPDAFRDGEKGDAMREGLDNLESACSSLNEAIDYLGEWAR